MIVNGVNVLTVTGLLGILAMLFFLAEKYARWSVAKAKCGFIEVEGMDGAREIIFYAPKPVAELYQKYGRLSCISTEYAIDQQWRLKISRQYAVAEVVEEMERQRARWEKARR